MSGDDEAGGLEGAKHSDEALAAQGERWPAECFAPTRAKVRWLQGVARFSYLWVREDGSASLEQPEDGGA